MEKETELYLIEKIKYLDSENAYLKRQVNKGYERKRFDVPFDPKDIPIQTEQEFIAKYQGYDVEKLLRKANAFDTIVDALGIETCHWVEDKKFEIVARYRSAPIDEKTHKFLWGVLTNGK